MAERCDLCGNAALEQVYVPQSTVRGLSVWLCTHCGLVQSLPRADRSAQKRERRVSSDADWGNVRYGKAFRAAHNLDLLRPFLAQDRDIAVLDVGANRGAFIQALGQDFPKASITGVEPDASVVTEWAHNPRFAWIAARIEETRLADASFDAIYSCHTIEHLRSPKETLAQHWRTLKHGGILCIEAPNLALTGSCDIVEEFFIDKHLFHFSERTLTRLLTASGFRIIQTPDTRDIVNVTILAVKDDHGRAPIASDQREVESAASLMSGYQATRFKNIGALARMARIIESLRPRKVAIWGAGRLLHSLIQHGGLDPKSLAAVVDSHLSRHMREVHGAPLSGPEALANLKPGIVVVMSRSFAEEIRAQARTHAPGAEVMLYSDLLAEAKAA
jgi:2-polyprenyl-3-methyl-5-hydroxy-6-metoxy-1,4-benzoquinol methylase